ncbi:MAG: alpha/beta hydrolase [Amycolatopsis sp.]|uniref:alpha/beta hydrolase n=1 Tax=Amycolatopsis sp. TaxID=37632 RepID=UPI00260C56EF|nr:alpha/beta hydrolase [Amycolatopsis sp.]MCU1683943.1 alpha/beta hydrolase [Amycolatopsis sp.]
MPSQQFHPDLRATRFLPRITVGPRSLRLARLLVAAGVRPRPDAVVVPVEPGVSVRVFRPAKDQSRTPALLWMHGGGYVVGLAAQEDPFCRRIADQLDIVVASVEYRVAPEYPFPTPLHDCYAALSWLAGQPDVDPQRIAIGGASSGGGLAAALALLAKERGEIQPVLQLLTYPMLDDRTTTRLDIDQRSHLIWSAKSNRFGWRSYLGPAYGGDVSPLAAPARSDDLSGLPPTWLGVGTCDLFHDENLAYAKRLEQAGVDCTLHVTPGAYHGFNVIEPKAPVSRAFSQSQITALARALNSDETVG